MHIFVAQNWFYDRFYYSAQWYLSVKFCFSLNVCGIWQIEVWPRHARMTYIYIYISVTEPCFCQYSTIIQTSWSISPANATGKPKMRCKYPILHTVCGKNHHTADVQLIVAKRPRVVSNILVSMTHQATAWTNLDTSFINDDDSQHNSFDNFVNHVKGKNRTSKYAMRVKWSRGTSWINVSYGLLNLRSMNRD